MAAGSLWNTAEPPLPLDGSSLRPLSLKRGAVREGDLAPIRAQVFDGLGPGDPSPAGDNAAALVVFDRIEASAPLLPGFDTGDQERVDRYVSRASAAATLRAYRSDWRINVA